MFTVTPKYIMKNVIRFFSRSNNVLLVDEFRSPVDDFQCFLWLIPNVRANQKYNHTYI